MHPYCGVLHSPVRFHRSHGAQLARLSLPRTETYSQRVHKVVSTTVGVLLDGCDRICESPTVVHRVYCQVSRRLKLPLLSSSQLATTGPRAEACATGARQHVVCSQRDARGREASPHAQHQALLVSKGEGNPTGSSRGRVSSESGTQTTGNGCADRLLATYLDAPAGCAPVHHDCTTATCYSRQ